MTNSEDIIFVDPGSSGPGWAWETFGVLPRNWQTGCGEIDGEHRALLAFIDDGWRASIEGETICLAKVLEVLASLHMRMRSHFDHEEAEMARLRYPGLREHAACHCAMLAGLNSAEVCLWETGIVDREALRETFAALIDDILRADAPFKSFLYDSGRIVRLPTDLPV